MMAGDPKALVWRSLAAVMASSLAAGFTIGMTVPLISLALEQRGASAFLIGANSGVMALAVLLVAPLLPGLLAGIGTLPVLYLGIGISCVSLALFPVFDGIAVWFCLRLILGIGIALHWIVSETWINIVAHASSRGRAVSAYATVWGAGIAIGPQIMTLTGVEGALPFLVGSGILALAVVPLLLASGLAPTVPSRSAGGGLLRAWRAAPVAMAAGFVAGFSETAIFALLPLFGLAVGYDAAGAVLMVSVFAAGSLLFQPPLGWLADRGDCLRLLVFCAVVGAFGAAALPAATMSGPVLWPLLLLWGGIVVGFYTLGLIMIGRQFDHSALPAANAGFITAYTLGSLGGPASGGAIMDIWPLYGLPVVVLIVFGGFLLISRLGRRQRSAEDGSTA